MAMTRTQIFNLCDYYQEYFVPMILLFDNNYELGKGSSCARDTHTLNGCGLFRVS